MLALRGVFLLELGDMKETSVGSVEQSDPTWKIETHHPVLGVTWHHGTDHKTELTDEPVQVKKGNGRERQSKTSDSEDGRTTVIDEE